MSKQAFQTKVPIQHHVSQTGQETVKNALSGWEWIRTHEPPLDTGKQDISIQRNSQRSADRVVVGDVDGLLVVLVMPEDDGDVVLDSHTKLPVALAHWKQAFHHEQEALEEVDLRCRELWQSSVPLS